MTNIKRLAIVLAWLLIWQLVALLVGNQILLAGPIEVVQTLALNLLTVDFWASVGFSLIRIVGGFLAAFVFGVAVGSLAGRFKALEQFLEPALQFVKSVPIVCFIVLLLIWFGSPWVSAIAVFLVVLPAIYFAVLQALQAKSRQMGEMLQVFRVRPMRRALVYSWPSLLPFLTSTSRVVVGMSWKAGVAAELIGLPMGSIGENIYHAKLTLSSAELLAWTLVVVLLSLVCEKLFLALLQRSEDFCWRVALPQPSSSGELTNQSQANELPIVLDKVNLLFAGQPVWPELSLELQPGGRYALRGASGSGKTTLLLLLAGLLVPDSGSVQSPASLAMVFQEARLFEGRSAIDNVSIICGQSVSRKQIVQALQAVLPEDSWQKPVSELSGGMRRRVELVRALLHPSQLLLLDEPFAGLDSKSKAAATTLLLQQLHSRTLVLATHDNSDEQSLSLESIEIPAQG